MGEIINHEAYTISEDGTILRGKKCNNCGKLSQSEGEYCEWCGKRICNYDTLADYKITGPSHSQLRLLSLEKRRRIAKTTSDPAVINEIKYDNEKAVLWALESNPNISREMRVFVLNRIMQINKTIQIQREAARGKNSGCCYIATAVYGSYDCPEVWTLRRYRDNVLDHSWYGRLFIRCYYATSPTLVKWFGTTTWFKKIFRNRLNKWVNKLNAQGFEATPYQDKY